MELKCNMIFPSCHLQAVGFSPIRWTGTYPGSRFPPPKGRRVKQSVLVDPGEPPDRLPTGRTVPGSAPASSGRRLLAAFCRAAPGCAGELAPQTEDTPH